MNGWVQIFSGFEEHQPDANARGKWFRVSVSIEDGELRCSLAKDSVWPVAVFYLAAAQVTTTVEGSSHMIHLTLKENVHVWLIPGDAADAEADIDQWLSALKQQADMSNVLPVEQLNKLATELEDYFKDITNETTPAHGVMEVTLGGKIHRLPVTLDDNVQLVAEQFASQYSLKPTTASTLEIVLMRTQIDAAKEKIASLKDANKRLRMHSVETSALRRKAAEADVRILELQSELAAVKTAIPELDALLDGYLTQNKALQQQSIEMHNRLQEERVAYEQTAKDSQQQSKQKLQAADNQIQALSRQVQQLRDRLAEETDRAANSEQPALDPQNPDERLYTPRAPSPRSRNYEIKSDRFAPAVDNGWSDSQPPNGAPSTAPARILSRAERTTLWTPLAAGVGTKRLSESNSPSRLAQTNKDLTSKLRNLEQVRAQYADKILGLQQTARTFEIQAQESQQEVQKLKLIVRNLKESMEYRTMIKVQEENKGLKQQMIELKGELARVKWSIQTSQTQQQQQQQHNNNNNDNDSLVSSTFDATVDPGDGAAAGESPHPQQRRSVTAPVSETTVKALPLTPRVQSHVLRVIFDKYAVNQVMTRFKFQQFTREYNIISAKDLVAGDVDVLFTFALRTTRTNKAHLPKQPMRPSGPYKSGVQEPHHNFIDIKQFEFVLSSIAVRLYVPLIETSLQTQIYLLEDQERDVATTAAVEILYKEKLIPVADRTGLIRWSAIYIAETRALYSENEMFVEQVSQKSAILLEIFCFYSHKLDRKIGDDGLITENEDAMEGSLTFRALSQLAHDFGICPILVEIARLYELYLELDEEATVARAQNAQDSAKVSWAQPELNLPVHPNRLNYSQYLALLAVIANQYFPDSEPIMRIDELLRWMDKSGGFHLLRRDESQITDPFA